MNILAGRGRRARLKILLPLTALALAAAGCSSSPAGSSSAASQLNILASPVGPLTDGFNPFNSSNGAYLEGATGMVYEPLMQYNMTKVGQIYPWLATSWSWTDSGKELVLHTRAGVKWSDGKPFTAADVAFTFNLMKKYPALDINGVSFTSATAPTSTEAVLKFTQPAYTQLFAISQVLIVPQHIWSQVSNPVTYTDDNPVGTGPYLAGSFTAQEFTLVRNPHYWQAGLPKFSKLEFLTADDATDAANVINTGSIDWNTVGYLSWQTGFVDKDPAQRYESISQIGDWYLCPNLSHYPLNLVPVRKAISMAFNRNTIAAEGEKGLFPADNTPTGLALPRWQTYLAPQFASLKETFDPSAAKAILENAGFKPGSNGMLNLPNGKPFTLTLSGATPYSDWMTDLQLISSEMAQAGIRTTVKGSSVATWINDVNTGNYDLTFCGTFDTNDPYSIYNYLMNSSPSAPDGTFSKADAERFDSPQADAALAAIANSNSLSAQRQAYTTLESIMVNDIPVIPLFNGGAWAGYTTTHAVGWPTASDPYEMNSVASPWDEVVVLHLRPAA